MTLTPEAAVLRASWPIIPECPAPKHNTRCAAQGVRKIDRREQRHEPCICPRAVHLLSEYRAKRQIYYQELTHGMSKTVKAAPPDGKVTPVHQRRNGGVAPGSVHRMPDFSAGACRTVRGIMVMNIYIENQGSERAARDLCDLCPIRRECLAWAVFAETPAGSWYGMYGGRTPQERATDATRAAARASA